MNINELNHIAIEVRNVGESVDFYKNVLGLKQLPRPAFNFEGAWFRIGDKQELHIIGGRKEPVSSGSRGSHFALTVDSIAEAEQILRKKGIDYFPPKPRPDGVIQLFLKDPDGYFIELATHYTK